MNKALLIVFFSFTFSSLWAQEEAPFSLQRCIEYALANQPRMKASRLDEEMQIEKNKEIIGMARPQVKANGQFQYLFITPKQRVDANAFNFGSSFSFFKIDTPAYQAYLQQPKDKYSQVKFGLPLNSSLGITASQILFDAGVLVAIQARESLEELTRLNTERTAEEIRVAVSKAYYNCVVAEKRMAFLKDNIKLLSSVEDLTQKLYAEGFAERIEVDRITVQKNNLLTEQSKIQNLIDLGYALLKFQMGMDLNTTIQLTDELNVDQIKSGIDLETVSDFSNRIEMRLLNKADQLLKYDLKRYEKGYLPTVAAAVSGSYASQTIAFKELFTLPYFPTGAFVLSASVPLYDGGTRKAKIRQAQLSILKNDNDRQSFLQAASLESGNAKTQFKNSILSLDNQKHNIELAEKVYDIAQRKYKEGVGTNIEILQAETALKEAKINYYNTLFEAMIAKIDFQKSLGQLK